MKIQPTVILVVAAAFSGLALARPTTSQASLEERVQALEEQLSGAGSGEEALAEDVAELKELAEATIAYLDAQAKAASKMERTLASSEDAGFTFGINPKSREILLEGWRETLATMQSDVPGAKDGKKKNTPRSARR
jgi:hypothetical protein